MLLVVGLRSPRHQQKHEEERGFQPEGRRVAGAPVFVVGDVRELWPFLLALVVSLLQFITGFQPKACRWSTVGIGPMAQG